MTTAATCSAVGLLHVLPHVSSGNVRPNLNGVYFRPDGVLIATNGHTLGMYRAGHTIPGGAILKFPKSATAILKRTAKKSADYEIIVRFNVDGVACRMDSPWTSESVALEVVEGPYPNTAAVLPWNVNFNPVEIIAFDAKLAGMFYHTASIARMECRFQAAERAISVRTEDAKFYGMLMPLRAVGNEDVGNDVPKWTRDTPPAAECAA